MNNREYYIYIATNKRRTVFYTGMTNNIARRMHEHKEKQVPGFTKKYNIDVLICYHIFNDPTEAIEAEKKIKGWSRQKKLNFVKQGNPELKDLSSYL